MFSNPLIAFGKTTYSQTGNLLGYDGGVPARLSDKTRRYDAMHVTGTEDDRTNWVIEQVLQDLDRKNLVVLRDPKGLATAEIIARVDKGYLKGKDECTEDFDETSDSAPGFCLGREVGSETAFESSERESKWNELQETYSASLQGYENLAMISLPGMSSGTECPANTASE